MHAQVLDFAQVDSWRSQRTGFPEVVSGNGKSPEQIAAIMRQLAQNEQLVMATRISPQVGFGMCCMGTEQEAMNFDEFERQRRKTFVSPLCWRVAI